MTKKKLKSKEKLPGKLKARKKKKTIKKATPKVKKEKFYHCSVHRGKRHRRHHCHKEYWE